MGPAPRPITEIPAAVCRGLAGLLFDIDDTFTRGGKIRPCAFDAIWKAREAGLRVVPVTGRPAGWADHIARMWPVDGVVAENGGLYFALDEGSGRMIRRFHEPDETARRKNLERLWEIYAEVKEAFPGVEPASDQPYRVFDIAVDFCEDIAEPLSLADAGKIKEIFERCGATAKVSSIHVNAWFGDFDKLSMCRTFLADRFGVDLDNHRDRYVFCGDSPNDEPMFEFFPNAAAVAGLERYAEQGLIDHLPAFAASEPGSEGFAEIVGTILEKRG